MDAKQFAWLYLIEHGYAGMREGTYGRNLVCPRVKAKFPNDWMGWDFYKEAEQFYLEEIRTIGVDWDKTVAPRSDLVSVFNGTFCDAGEKETLVGTLVLKNGDEQMWVADAIEVTNVFEMMAFVDQAKDRFKKLFS
jgi:hypothetical protein